MNRNISLNVQSIELSGIRKFYNKVALYPSAISLTLGEPDFKVPLKVKEAMTQAIAEDKTHYTSNAGLIELREEISKYLSSYKIDFSPEEICITVGGSEGILSVFTSIINAGDKVLIPTPAYPAYESCVRMLGGAAVHYELDNSFHIDFDKLEHTLELEKPKVMVLSFPSNPTGAVMTLEERDRLGKIIRDRDIVVVTDEMYAEVFYEDRYCSIAQCNDIKDKIILVSGFSKIFSMTGLRIGYVCAGSEFIEQIVKVHQYAVSCAPSISQYGALAGLKYCREDVEYMKAGFKERRDYLYERLNSLGFTTNKPEGAFYIFPSIKKFGVSSEEFAERLLSEAGVAVVPGSAFGKGGEGHVRISYSYSMDALKEAMDRIEKWQTSSK